jgi:archaemetzincin
MNVQSRFSLVLLICITLLAGACGKSSNPVVGIQPYGNFKSSLTDTIKQTLEDAYGFEVVILSGKELPQSAFVTFKSPRYRADSLIRILKRKKPDSIDFVIGLIAKDISTTKRDNLGRIKKPTNRYSDFGIFGLGYRPGPSCVVSTYRLHHKNTAKFFDRFKKICIHEIGHNMGLKHCDRDEDCVMRDAAESIKTIDNVEPKLCTECSKDIQ